MGHDVQIEKRKWDGTLSSVELARMAPSDGEALAWLVPRGSTRRKPEKGETEQLACDEIWACRSGEWWMLCGYGQEDGTIASFDLHASVPPEVSEPGRIRWIDLDLDLELRGDSLEMVDEAQFHEHALTMHYPDDVIRGAWAGISQLAPRYTTKEWPFDGWLERSLRAAQAELGRQS